MQKSGVKVAYAGRAGAYAEIMCMQIFKDSEIIPYGDFDSAYNSVGDECDYAVLPIENSYAGEVIRVGDLAFSGDKHIIAVYSMAINHCLMGVHGSSFETVKKVYSHEQALLQCDKYIKKHGFEKYESNNTALAAEMVARENDKSMSVIGSERASEIYDLDILEKNISESSTNTTRFAVFAKKPEGKAGNFIMFFTLKNEAGSLGNATSAIGKFGFNMRALRSRPTKLNNWEYYFYVEAEGDLESKKGKKMLELLKKYCLNIKIVGNYEKEIQV